MMSRSVSNRQINFNLRTLYNTQFQQLEHSNYQYQQVLSTAETMSSMKERDSNGVLVDYKNVNRYAQVARRQILETNWQSSYSLAIQNLSKIIKIQTEKEKMLANELSHVKKQHSQLLKLQAESHKRSMQTKKCFANKNAEFYQFRIQSLEKQVFQLKEENRMLKKNKVPKIYDKNPQRELGFKQEKCDDSKLINQEKMSETTIQSKWGIERGRISGLFQEQEIKIRKLEDKIMKFASQFRKV